MSEPTPTVAYDPAVDDLIDGRYRLGRLLGQGGYSRVYEAVDTALERTLALKIIEDSAPASVGPVHPVGVWRIAMLTLTGPPP